MNFENKYDTKPAKEKEIYTTVQNKKISCQTPNDSSEIRNTT